MCKWNYKIRLWAICLFFALFGMVPSRIAGFFPNNAQETMIGFIRASIFGNATETEESKSCINTIWALYVAQSGPCTVLGSLLAPTAAKEVGRVKAIGMGLLVAIPGFALQFLAAFQSVWFLLLVGQFLVYLSMAFLYVVFPIFVSESAPPSYRGRLGTVQFIGVATGTLIGAIFGLPDVFGQANVWQYAYVICSVLALIGLPFAFLLKETPVALLSQGERTKARRSLEYYRGPENAVTDWHNVLLDSASTFKAKQSGIGSIYQLFKIKQLRQSLHIAMVLSLAYFVPVVVNAYSTPMMQHIGFDHAMATYLTSGLMLASFASYFICTLMIDRYGRWPLVMVGTAGSTIAWSIMTLCQFLYSYTSFSEKANKGLRTLFCLALYTAQITLNVGIRPTFWVVIPEIFPYRYRVAAKSLSVAATGFYGFVVLFLFFVTLQWLPMVAHSIVVICLLVCAVFMFAKLPETKQKAPHEIFPQFLDIHELLPELEITMSPVSPSESGTSNPISVEGGTYGDDFADNCATEETPLNPIQKTYS